jgi:hypothetical protein
MREKFARFMAGRCGADQLNRFLSVLSLVLMIIAVVFNGTVVSRLVWMIAFVLLVLVYARMLSRNLYRRSAENNSYLCLRANLTGKIKMFKLRWSQRREYKFFTCPSCHTTLRVPRHKGKISIVCKKCGNSFTGKT